MTMTAAHYPRLGLASRSLPPMGEVSSFGPAGRN